MRHTPRFWIVTAATLMAVGLTASLGHWQLNRAAEKIALQAAIDAQGRLPPLANADVADDRKPETVHRTAELKGRWRADLTVFLDNRQMAGKVGLFVMTPLALAGSGRLVMVQRGWVPRNFVDRSKLPEVRTPDGEVTLRARLAAPPSKLYEFASANGDNGVLRQNLDLAAYAAEKRVDLLTHLSAIETDAPADGLSRDWPALNTGVDRHYGYAFQWFGLSALLVVLYVWFQFIQPRRSRRAR